MSTSPYVPFYTSDFLAGTSGMTASTKGVYITLLCLMYEAEMPLHQKWDTLARRCGCTLPAFKKAISDLQDDGKLDETDVGLWSETCDKHIAQRRERSDSARSAAEKRWQKDEQKQRKPDTTASSAQCQPEPEPEPDISPNGDSAHKVVQIESSSKKRRKPETVIPEGWAPSRDLAERLMNEHGLTKEELILSFKAMEAHAHANERKQRDWDATYRQWVISEISYGKIGPKSKARRSGGGQASMWD